MCLLQMFSPSLWFSFHSLDSVFHQAEVFNFNEVQLMNSFFHGSCLWGHMCVAHYTIPGHLDFLLWSSF